MLEWMGKQKVVNHHNDVPFHVLERKWGFDGRAVAPRPPRSARGADPTDMGCTSLSQPENMIIHGDNLLALKSLLPRYEGRVKCIYIDPPYNTGNEGWVYNDNVNDPQINKWLNKVVGKEGEDFSRHDKWLCMMYPRLKLLQKLLAKDGAIFISIDDNELFSLKLICDEIFGSASFVCKITWQNNHSPRNDAKGIPYISDNILVYGKNPNWQPKRLPRTEEMDDRFSSPDNDPIPWTSAPVHAPSAKTHRSMVYAIQHPVTGELIYPPSNRCWSREQRVILEIMNEWAPYELREIDDLAKRAGVCGVAADASFPNVRAVMLAVPLEEAKEMALKRVAKGNWPEFYFTKDGFGGMRVKKHLTAMKGKVAASLWFADEVGTSTEATNELKEIFEGKVPFDTAKPTRLVERILQIASDKDSIVLDSFAGSGTTAHAVLNANAKDGGTRRFVLVEMMDYAESVTAERVKRVMWSATYPPAKPLREAKSLEWCGTPVVPVKDAATGETPVAPVKDAPTGETPVVPVGFGFYELGPQLMIDGVLNEDVPTEKIREYVWYTETCGGAGRAALPSDTTNDKYLLGEAFGVAYYFCYEKEKSMTLNRAMLKKIKTKAESYVIYADACTLSPEELEKMHITFKKIPRDVTRF